LLLQFSAIIVFFFFTTHQTGDRVAVSVDEVGFYFVGLLGMVELRPKGADNNSTWMNLS
jgi:hypothetical protein